MTGWVKVEFYGQLPPGVVAIEVDHKEVSESLAKVFGFKHIDGLVAKRDAREDNMNVEEYQDKTQETAGPYLVAAKEFLDRERRTIFVDNTEPTQTEKFLRIAYLAGKLNGEAGEVAEEIFKAFRDDLGEFTDVRFDAIMKELGDVMWYISQLCNELDLELADVLALNITKLQARKSTGNLQGSGSDR
jgi:NTP pyrophosphatase (non-canonical NTP hydrolase)